MTQTDFDRFDALMQGVAECYGQTLSAQGIALRFKLLEGFALSEVEKAVLSIMASRKYTSMPVPADFLEHISGGAAEDKADVVFDDAVTQAVIVQSYGGWVKLCHDCGPGCENGESEHWFRKNFAKTWAAYSRQGVTLNGHLPGLIEISNHSNGFYEHIPAPKLIGIPSKANAVLEAGGKPLALNQGPENIRGEIHALSGLLEVVAGVTGRQ